MRRLAHCRHWLPVCSLALALLCAPAPAARAQAPAPAAPAAAARPAPAPEAPPAGGAWLDASPLPRWNTQGAAVPKPPSIQGEPLATGRCSQQVRPADGPADRALSAAGWTLVGPLQVFGEVSVATAAIAADGMCRPLGLQAFVFVRGRFAGTLSPHPMEARTDGVVTDVRLVTRDRVLVTYARYATDDPLCCPSRTSSASFSITRSPGGSVLALESVDTSPAAR